MNIPEFNISRINNSDHHWDVFVDLEDGQKYFGSFCSLEKLIDQEPKLDSTLCTILVDSLDEHSVREKIIDFLKNDNFYTAFFPVNKVAVKKLFDFVS